MKLNRTVKNRSGRGRVVSKKRCYSTDKSVKTSDEQEIKKFVDEFYAKHRGTMSRLAYE